MVANGISLLLFGSIIGVMRDVSGTYASCIVFINAVTVLTLVMWLVEMIYVHISSKKSNILKLKSVTVES